jgi:hypothetical protein
MLSGGRRLFTALARHELNSEKNNLLQRSMERGRADALLPMA